jgi:hypothetical protein
VVPLEDIRPYVPQATAPSAQCKYDQTWTVSYGEATCRDWRTRMDAHQRWVMAGDMLFAMRRGDDPDVGITSDLAIDAFASGLTNACTSPDGSGQATFDRLEVAEVAVLLYAMIREG